MELEKGRGSARHMRYVTHTGNEGGGRSNASGMGYNRNGSRVSNGSYEAAIERRNGQKAIFRTGILGLVARGNQPLLYFWSCPKKTSFCASPIHMWATWAMWTCTDLFCVRFLFCEVDFLHRRPMIMATAVRRSCFRV